MKIVIVENDETWLKKTIKNVNKILNTEKIRENITYFTKYTNKLKNIIYNKDKKYIF